MKKKQTNNLSVDVLISEYKEAALAHEKASLSGNYRVANREYETLVTIAKEIISRGSSAKDAFLCLLSDQNAFVKIWAATHALAFAPAQGEQALAEASHLSGLAGHTANITLQEWQAGKLRSDWLIPE
jgi:hypothetical protein